MECMRCTAVMEQFVERADESGRSESKGWRCRGCGEVVRPIVTTSWIWWRAQAGRSRRTIFYYVIHNHVIRAIEGGMHGPRFPRRSEGRGSAMPGPLRGDTTVLRAVPNQRQGKEQLLAINQGHTLVRYRLHRRR